MRGRTSRQLRPECGGVFRWDLAGFDPGWRLPGVGLADCF
jgi:hypothetical protein